MNRKCLCFIGGLGAVGMLATAGLKASDGAEVDYGREWAPYVTVRGGWLFGKCKVNSEDLVEMRGSAKSAWSGSAELGASCDDRIFVGLELGYFTGKMKLFEKTFNPPERSDDGTLDIGYFSLKGSMKNFFGVCNATFRNDLNDRAFLYGGVGAGIVRRTAECEVCARGTVVMTGNPFEEKHKDNVKKWQFLGQAFTGLGVYLNDNWQLTVGYRLRWMPGSLEQEGVRVKQDILHAAEVGLTYRF